MAQAAETRKRNLGNTSTAPKATNRVIDLSGTRKLRASVPTLVGHLNNAKSIQYFHSANRSIIVLG